MEWKGPDNTHCGQVFFVAPNKYQVSRKGKRCDGLWCEIIEAEDRLFKLQRRDGMRDDVQVVGPINMYVCHGSWVVLGYSPAK